MSIYVVDDGSVSSPYVFLGSSKSTQQRVEFDPYILHDKTTIKTKTKQKTKKTKTKTKTKKQNKTRKIFPLSFSITIATLFWLT